MNKNDAVEKIKKCLNLAKSANENEAAQALKHAQALMREFGLTELDITLMDITEASAKIPIKPSKWQLYVFSVCAYAFGCQGYIDLSIKNGKTTSQFKFYGISPKPELATYAAEVLLRQLKAERRAFIKNHLNRLKSAKNKAYRADEFCRGWIVAVQNKVEKFALSEDEKLKLEAYSKNELGEMSDFKPREIKASNSVKQAGREDYLNGFSKGKEANLYHAMNTQKPNILKIGE